MCPCLIMDRINQNSKEKRYKKRRKERLKKVRWTAAHIKQIKQTWTNGRGILNKKN